MKLEQSGGVLALMMALIQSQKCFKNSGANNFLFSNFEDVPLESSEIVKS